MHRLDVRKRGTGYSRPVRQENDVERRGSTLSKQVFGLHCYFTKTGTPRPLRRFENSLTSWTFAKSLKITTSKFGP